MAERKGFDLGAALRAAVPDSGTDKDRIVRFDVDAIEPDPRNFYSMSGIEELMASIELVGLQQPLLVRQHPDKAAAVMIVSGHRRREAIKRLVAEGREDLRMVPCIMERAGGSAALDELRLIYANSGTRHLTGAEISSQAQRVEALLYELKEQGFEFPGRMRDHVAEACKVSKSKLARLKVIRDSLIPTWAARWNRNELSESTAYRLAQCSPEHQSLLFAHLGAERYVYESTVEGYDKRITDAEASKHPRGGACENIENKLHCVMKRNAYADNYCKGCCGDCPNLASCKYSCIRQKDKAARLKADKRAQAKQEAEAHAAEVAPKLEMVRTVWQRWDAARQAAGKTVKEMCEASGFMYTENREKSIAKLLAEFSEGKAKINEYQELPVGLARSYELIGLVKTADALGVSVDYLLGRTEDMQPLPVADQAVAPEGFRSGKTPPAEKTLAWCAFIVDGHELTTAAVWWPHLGKWCFEHGAGIDAECVGWIPLPDWRGVLRDKDGGGKA